MGGAYIDRILMGGAKHYYKFLMGGACYNGNFI